MTNATNEPQPTDVPSVLRKIWTILTRRERISAAILVAMMLLGMVLETFGIGMVIPAISLLAKPDFLSNSETGRRVLEAMGTPNQETIVVLAMVVFVAAYLLKTIFMAVLAWRQNAFAFRIQADLSQRLFSLYLLQPYSFHLQRNSAHLIQNTVAEVALFSSGALSPIMTVLTECFVLAGISTLLFVVEPVGACIVIATLGLSALGLQKLTGARVSHWGKIRQRHEALRLQHLQQGLGGAKEVKLLGREKNFLDTYRTHNTWVTHVAQLQATVQQMPRLWLEMLAICGLAILIATMVARGRPIDLILPTVGLFAAAAFRLMPSCNRVLVAVQSLKFGLPVVDALHSELLLPVRNALDGESTPLPAIAKVIRVDNVDFRYQGAEAMALTKLTMEINAGETVGIIGSSGAGKSSLVDLLLGLLQPTNGRVTVDGRDIQSHLRSWQDQIGYVPQAIFITDDSLRRNIAFGVADEDIDDAAIHQALHSAALDDLVASLPDGIDAMVGERGARLSGGQRQRIGIARALYHNPPVLVLDEATSALDTETEREVMASIRKLHGEKTIIIAAHRLTTVKDCDRIFRIDAGMLAGVGTPIEMLPHEFSPASASARDQL